MERIIASIGFGEAGQAFARPGVRSYDRKVADPTARAALLDACRAHAVEGCDTPQAALAGAHAVLSLVTADQALPAARAAVPHLAPGALWLDMNSVAPDTKRAAAQAITAAGGRYVDVAVMAPVLPVRLAVPLLLAGPDAAEAEVVLRDHGFTNVALAGPTIGDASSIKMIRSVMVKGLEALTAECALAAERAGVRDAVIASLDASWKPQGWESRIDYNLDRMMAHGLRRAAEMEEVAVTLEALGVEPAMTRGTIRRQHALGSLGLTPPDGLTAKLAALGDTA
ncbi:6-phosphogluconate dehydrogenase [Sphingomonas sp. Leaf23]|uniref:NAD(P)-dependent oxidoreductase n=1 Tax=Sphingomonas sp. Leaf23 TaxID=1735689 RepID=UPI0006FF7FB9|nr:NAD(P)-dependent oxidoreductase [Sphingomonas sp. Leaf23]KQM85897.1 6-phosphogluconate dehydrogenase [Sphingomonas sp. Leaf23]